MQFVKDCVNKGTLLAEVRKCAGFEFLTEQTYKKMGGRSSPPVIYKHTPGKKAAKRHEEAGRSMLEGAILSGRDGFLYEARNLGIVDKHKHVCYWSLFGDGHVEDRSGSYYYTEAHAFSQAPYLWSKAALLGNYLSNMNVHSSVASYDRDARISVTSIVDGCYKDMHRRFYSADGKKDVMSEELFEDFSIEALAWWIMDDGSRYLGTVDWVVAHQPHYSLLRAERVAAMVGEKTGIPVTVHQDWPANRDEPTSYTFKVPEAHLPLLLPYVHPNLAYKFTDHPHKCGSWWGPELLSVCDRLFSSAEHPYLHTGEDLPTDLLLTALVSRTRVRGFPYPLSTAEERAELFGKILQAGARVSEVEGEVRLLASVSYNRMPSLYFPNRYCVRSMGRRSPMGAFRSKSVLRSCLEKQLASGGGFSQGSIRASLCYGDYVGKVAAQFSPLVAKYVYSHYSPKGAHVLDPCAGWGGRMTGAAAAGVATYTGIEPEASTREGLRALAMELPGDTFSASVVDGVAEDITLYRPGSVDTVFTCPPYFNHERYPEDPRQSWKVYPTYTLWKAGFLTPLISNSHYALRKGGSFVLAVGNTGTHDIVSDSTFLAQEAGFTFVERLAISTSGRWDSSYREYLLVFRRF